MTYQDKQNSPYPELQAILPILAFASPRRDMRPIFENEEEAVGFAKAFTEQEGVALLVEPVWAIDHDDLDASHIAGWSVIPAVN